MRLFYLWSVIFKFSYFTFANLLVVTFLTFQTTNIFYSNAIHFTGPEIVMELFVNAVELITSAVAVIESDFGFAVAVDTPTHA